MGGSSGPAFAGGDFLVQYAGMNMGGSSGSTSGTFCWKPLASTAGCPQRSLRMNVMGLGAIIDIGAKTVTSGINDFTFSGGTCQFVIAAQFNLANVIFHIHIDQLLAACQP